MEREDLASKFHLLSYLLLPVPFGGCRSKHGEGGVWPQSQLLLPVGGRPVLRRVANSHISFQFFLPIPVLYFLRILLILDSQLLVPVYRVYRSLFFTPDSYLFNLFIFGSYVSEARQFANLFLKCVLFFFYDILWLFKSVVVNILIGCFTGQSANFIFSTPLLSDIEANHLPVLPVLPFTARFRLVGSVTAKQLWLRLFNDI